MKEQKLDDESSSDDEIVDLPTLISNSSSDDDNDDASVFNVEQNRSLERIRMFERIHNRSYTNDYNNNNNNNDHDNNTDMPLVDEQDDITNGRIPSVHRIPVGHTHEEIDSAFSRLFISKSNDSLKGDSETKDKDM